jgi:hypothetical protein
LYIRLRLIKPIEEKTRNREIATNSLEELEKLVLSGTGISEAAPLEEGSEEGGKVLMILQYLSDDSGKYIPD